MIHLRTFLDTSSVVLACLLTLCISCRDRARTAPSEVDRSSGEIPSLRASRFPPGTIQIDGRLNEAAWQRTGSTGPLVHPGTGRFEASSRVQAHARVGWDDQYLYVGVVVHDPDPVTPFRPTDIDPHLWERSSAIELMIQPGDPGDNTDYYEIQVDPSGAVWDTHFEDYNRPIARDLNGTLRFGHQEWSSQLRQAAVVDRSAGHYTIEMAIPWTALASSRTAVPPRPGDTWRVNVYSFRDGQRDALAWSPILGQGNFHRASRFGRVTFAL